ncbi:hypothetical protein QTP88_020144 [Uroleucon formosanum]
MLIQPIAVDMNSSLNNIRNGNAFKLKMKYFVTIFVVFHISLILLQKTSIASPLDNYLDKNSLEDNGVELLTDVEEYMDKDAEDDGFTLNFPDVQKRKPSNQQIANVKEWESFSGGENK